MPRNRLSFKRDVNIVFLFISVGYTMKDISYRWSDGEKSVRISKEVELPQFKVLGHSQRSRAVALSTGNYSRLVCEIRFVRSMGYYLIQIYIPAGLIVVISWVSRYSDGPYRKLTSHLISLYFIRNGR